MYVTIILSKILYGTTLQELQGYMQLARRQANAAALSPEWTQLLLQLHAAIQAGGQLPAMNNVAELDSAQFIRFKAAGRRHQQAAGAKSFTDPLSGIIYSYNRADRTRSPDLQKWDTDHYQNLVGRLGPWGPRAATNRDHLLAHSINQLILRQGGNPYTATTAAELRRSGLAVTVSGKHHREGSSTYGGRVFRVIQQHAQNPQIGVRAEMNAMLLHKQLKGHARIEMVGAYAFLYKSLVGQTVIAATPAIDQMLIRYLRNAVQDDDHNWRIDPSNLGLTRQQNIAGAQRPVRIIPDPVKPGRWTTPGL